jgi:ATP-dependent RNA helicase SUPV3L1/SUV3
LLKPAPTRLRLVLWSLARGLQEFPEAPPPGLVTVPTVKDAPDGYHTMCGYRAAGERAVRIDMLERLADLLRAEDSRGGFEAKPDMLSITGTTLEQFADLMQGLGYKGERGERVKVKPAPVAPNPVADAVETVSETTAAASEADANAAPAEAAAEVSPEAETPAEAVTGDSAESTGSDGDASADTDTDVPEMEVFYTFTWSQRPQGGRGKGQPRSGGKPQGKGKPRAKGNPRRDGKREPGREQGGKSFSARPPRPEKKIDPDNPFAAALMGLKDKT